MLPKVTALRPTALVTELPQAPAARTALLCAASILLALSLGACQHSSEPPEAPGEPPAPAAPRAIFADRAAAAGLDFVHFNGMSGKRYFPEIAGSGAALFDYDGDGDLDVYLVQGSMLGPGVAITGALFPPPEGEQPTDRLYRNDLTVEPAGSGTLRFTDVTAESGLTAAGYGMGVAAGDFDNDGRMDLYVTRWGSNQLLLNLGDGTFRDVTREAGADDPRWSVSAAVLDFDRDGWLDLYVANYVDFSYAIHKDCFGPTGALDYCGPLAYQPQSDRLLHNAALGAGVRFDDVSHPTGIAGETGAGLGVTVADFDLDGRLDLYVGNDGTANHLWMNQGTGASGRATFENRALLAGCAVNREGAPEASMGVDAGDLDGDGDPDLFMSHLSDETNTLYANDGQGFFADESAESGLGAPSWTQTGFGTALFDYDNDGRLDVFVANGAVKGIERLAAAGDPYPLDQPNQLFHNLGGDAGAVRFEDVSTVAGEVFALEEVSRGAAFGDVDNDGDADVLLVNNSGPARLLINQVGQDNPWLGLRLLDGTHPRDALGARVEVIREGKPSLWRRVRTDGSYASANDPRILVGLGDSPRVNRLRVHWLSGKVEEWREVEAGRYTTLREGTGTEVP